MKKINKVNSVLLSIFILVSTCTLFGCSLFKDTPTPERALRDTYQIDMPKDWELIYDNKGSLGGFDGDGTCYFVFQTTERNDKIFNEFSDIKNADFELYIEKLKESNFGKYNRDIDPEYDFSLAQPYEWYFKKVVKKVYESGTKAIAELILIYQSQRIYMFSNYYNQPTDFNVNNGFDF